MQYSLFDPSQYEKRKLSSQTDFEHNNHELLMAWPSIVNNSFEKLVKVIFSKIKIESRDNKLASVALSGFLRGEVIKAFPQYCGRATKKRFKMYSGRGEWIFIKKLSNKQKRPSNIPTTENNKIIHQCSEAGSDLGQNVFLGYTSNKDKTHINGIWAVCINGSRKEWQIDVLDYATRNQKTGNIRVTKQEPVLKEGTVKLKKRKIS